MDKLFKWFTTKCDKAYINLCWFTSVFKVENFEKLDRLFFSFLLYCAFLGVEAKRKYLEAYLVTDGKTDVKKYNIRLDTLAALDYKEPAAFEEAFKIIGKTALEAYDNWFAEEINSDDSFKVDVLTFMSEYKKKSLENVFYKYVPKLSDGTDIDEVSSGMQFEFSVIDETFSKDKLDELDFMTGTKKDRKGNVKKMRRLFFNGLPCIDADSKGVWTKEIVTLNGQPGLGKTRFACKHYIYPALVEGKIDVLYDSMEMPEFKIKNMLVAIHIINIYRGAVKIPDSLMNKDELTTEQKQYYNSAWIDLFESGKYGNLYFRMNEPVQTMKKKTYNLIKLNRNIQLWVLDYMGRLKSKPQSKFDKSLDQYQIVTEGYEIVREITDTADIASLCLNQYNDKGIAAALAGKQIQPGFIEAGHIVHRITDYDLSLTSTEEQQMAHIAMINTTKNRGNEGFKNVQLQMDRSISSFVQINGKVGK